MNIFATKTSLSALCLSLVLAGCSSTPIEETMSDIEDATVQIVEVEMEAEGTATEQFTKYATNLVTVSPKCANLFTAMYGYKNNNPEAKSLPKRAIDYLHEARDILLFANVLAETAGIDSPQNKESIAVALFYKETISQAEKGDEQSAIFIGDELGSCANLIMFMREMNKRSFD